MVAGPDSTLQQQPARAIARACEKEGITPADLDLVEINEAFAAVGLASAKELGIDLDKVNVNGGAIALGHPIGMSGARIALHLALELNRRGGGVGAAALCGGGGQGDALDHPRAQDRLTSESLLRGTPIRRRPRPGRVGQGGFAARRRTPHLPRRGRPRSLRQVMAALAPHAATPRSSVSPARPGSAIHADDRPRGASASGISGSACWRSTPPPFSGGAILGDRIRMNGHALDPGSSSARGHPRAPGGSLLSDPMAVRVMDATGCDASWWRRSG